MKAIVRLTRSFYEFHVPPNYDLEARLRQRLDDVRMQAPRLCRDYRCRCAKEWLLCVPRPKLSYELALSLQDDVQFECALPEPPKKRLLEASEPGASEPGAAKRRRTNDVPSMALLDLPDEMLMAILLEVCVGPNHFRLQDIASCASSCQRLYGVAKTRILWLRVTRRLHEIEPRQGPASLALWESYLNNPHILPDRLPWKWATVPARFGVVRCSRSGGREIEYIKRRADGVILEYVSSAIRYKRYEIAQFGWRLCPSSPYRSFYMRPTHVTRKPDGKLTLFMCYGGRGRFLARYSHQLEP